MVVYEVLIDYNCTTRSHAASAGLFFTKEKAENFIKDQNLESWQYSSIVERIIQ